MRKNQKRYSVYLLDIETYNVYDEPVYTNDLEEAKRIAIDMLNNTNFDNSNSDEYIKDAVITAIDDNNYEMSDKWQILAYGKLPYNEVCAIALQKFNGYTQIADINEHKLYNKICNAINEGVLKALLIDPDLNDVSINYSYHKINNQLDFQEKIELILKEGYTEEQFEKINNLIGLDSGMLIYKPKDIFEISKLYNNIIRIYKDNKYMSWVDMSDIITYILKDDTEVAMQNCNNFNNVKFVKIKYSKRQEKVKPNDDYILIYKNILLTYGIQWQINYIDVYIDDINCKDENEALKDFNGYENTYKNINIYNNENDDINNDYYFTNTSPYKYYLKYNENENDFSNYPAFQYVNVLARKMKLYGYKAYLPAFAELNIFMANINFLNNYIFNNTFTNMLQDNGNYIWSSTENDKYWIYCYQVNRGIKYIYRINNNFSEYSHMFLIPFFKKISD